METGKEGDNGRRHEVKRMCRKRMRVKREGKEGRKGEKRRQ